MPVGARALRLSGRLVAPPDRRSGACRDLPLARRGAGPCSGATLFVAEREPGFVVFDHGQAVLDRILEFGHGRAKELPCVRNPDKLRNVLTPGAVR